jgi:hypothetical protein
MVPDEDRCEGVAVGSGKHRQCAHYAVIKVNGKQYCYYHNPLNPKKFGEGYVPHARKQTNGRKLK